MRERTNGKMESNAHKVKWTEKQDYNGIQI